jgi:hypothetical protein
MKTSVHEIGLIKQWLQAVQVASSDKEGGVRPMPSRSFLTAEYIQELETQLAAPTHLMAPVSPAASRNDFSRADPNNRKWDGSYTQTIFAQLCAQMPLSMLCATSPVYQAAQLLRDYHDTQHVVYEQRDEARKALAIEKRKNEAADEKTEYFLRICKQLFAENSAQRETINKLKSAPVFPASKVVTVHVNMDDGSTVQLMVPR